MDERGQIEALKAKVAELERLNGNLAQMGRELQVHLATYVIAGLITLTDQAINKGDLASKVTMDTLMNVLNRYRAAAAGIVVAGKGVDH